MYIIQVLIDGDWCTPKEGGVWEADTLSEAEFLADDKSEFFETTARILLDNQVAYETFYTID